MYLNYLKDVLGVKQFLVSENTTSSARAKTIGFYIPYKMTTDESDLLQKMITAMKIHSEQFQIFEDNTHAEMSDNTVAVCFDFSEKTDNPNCIYTFGPRACLSDAQNKKQTWNDLQRAMQVIGL